jgi:hypothetical protein
MPTKEKGHVENAAPRHLGRHRQCAMAGRLNEPIRSPKERLLVHAPRAVAHLRRNGSRDRRDGHESCGRCTSRARTGLSAMVPVDGAGKAVRGRRYRDEVHVVRHEAISLSTPPTPCGNARQGDRDRAHSPRPRRRPGHDGCPAASHGAGSQARSDGQGGTVIPTVLDHQGTSVRGLRNSTSR